MSEFNRVAFVWGESISNGPALSMSPSVTVALWPEVLGCHLLRWRGEPPDLHQYDVFLVNLFHTPDSVHIQQIRAARPDALIVAMPDPPLDQVLQRSADWMNMFHQMKLADVIGGRTRYDCQVYGKLLDKPNWWLPSPAGPTDYFAQFRRPLADKDDLIITQDHPWTESYMTAQNIAALRLIQAATGYRIVYTAAYPHTRVLANLAGLVDVDWPERLNWSEMIDTTARAKLCVDLYPHHSYHRQSVLAALLGTVCIGSTHCAPCGPAQVDPFDPEAARQQAEVSLLNYEHYQKIGYRDIENHYSFEASRARVRALMRYDGIRQTWQERR